MPRQLDRTITSRRILQRGENLVREGDRVDQAFIIRMGHLKSYRLHEDGGLQVLGLHGVGEVLGFEALIDKPSDCSIVALETSSIETFTFPDGLRSLIDGSEGLHELLNGLYDELQRRGWMLFIDRHPAERRLAEFFLDFSRQEADAGRSDCQLHLPLNRRDLACLLGLAPETLSRALGRFQEQGLLKARNRDIRILDMAGLVHRAEG